MRILHINAGKNWGGKEYRLINEMIWLLDHGHQTLLICDPGSELAKVAQQKALPHRLVTMKRRHDLRAALKLMGIAQNFRPEVINTHTSVDSYLCAPLKFLGYPTVRLQNIHLEDKQKLSTRLSYRLTCHRMICLTRVLEKTLINSFGFSPDQIDIIPDGINLEKFHPDHDGNKFRAEMGVNEKTKLVGMISMLRTEKGHCFFIDAAEKILRTRSDCKFIMIGSPTGSSNVLPHIQAKIRGLYGNLDITNPIVHLDYRDDIPEIFCALDIFVHPALSEAQGQVISEAFASRKPVVASNTGGIPERVVHGQTGLLVQPGDASDLAEKIESLLDQPDLCQRLAQNAYLRVHDDGSLDQMMGKMLESYRKAIAGI